ncbi:MAG: 7-cyano-7-deazaguanine synthase, partial [Candidatus Heimdallarchaeaceae archaeon]
MSVKPSALVLLSGGMDSTTLLYLVMKRYNYEKVEVIIFDYNQRHDVELRYAENIAKSLEVSYKVFEVDLTQFGGSFLTSKDDNSGMIVPARNSIFLSLATAYAETRGLQHIFFGPTLEDYNDFPDCRPVFVNLMS